MNGRWNRMGLFPVGALAAGLGLATVLQAAAPTIQHDETGRPKTGFYADERVEFAFEQGMRVRLGDEKLSGLSEATEAALSSLFDSYGAGVPQRLFSSISEAELDHMRARAGGSSPDLNNWFSCTVRDTKDAFELATALERIPGIRHAERVPLPRMSAMDLAPMTPDYTPMQHHLQAAPTGTGTGELSGITGADGSMVSVCILDGGWVLDHEDLDLTFLGGGNSGDAEWRNHGTACAGVLAAAHNSYGVTGMLAAPEALLAQGIFEEGSAAAWLAASVQLEAGDVISASWGYESTEIPAGYDCACGETGMLPPEANLANFEAIQTLTSSGIVVIEAAGNGCLPLDHGDFNGQWDLVQQDSGALIVAAADTDLVPACYTNSGSRIDAFAAGETVVSLGYGDLFLPGSDERQAYTYSFNGTSAATPVVAGAVAAMQSVFRSEHSGEALDAWQLRSLLRNTGTAQTGEFDRAIGLMPDLPALIDAMHAQEGVIQITSNITTDTFWSRDYVYLLTTGITVSSGATLTIEGGTVVKFQYQSNANSKRWLRVQGDLQLLGTPADPVVFTSERDDEYGGDSNGDGAATSASAGDWGFLRINNGDVSVENALFRYAGRQGTSNSVVWAEGVSPIVDHNVFENCYSGTTAIYYQAHQSAVTAPQISNNRIDGVNQGIYVDGGSSSRELTSPVIQGNEILNCSYAIQLNECDPLISGNLISHETENNEGTRLPYLLNGWVEPEFVDNILLGTVWPVVAVQGTISRDTRWTHVEHDLPYLIWSNITVNSGVELTMAPDLIVKFLPQSNRSANRYIRVNGELNLLSEPGHEIIFTSNRDDEYGGDSNGDDAVPPQEVNPSTSDWAYLRLNSDATEVHDVIFRYGGRRDSDRHNVIFVDGYSPVIRDCQFVDCYSSTTAIYYSASQGTVTAPQIHDNTISNLNQAIYLDGNGSSQLATQPLIARNTIADCSVAIQLNECTPSLVENQISHSNTSNEGTRLPFLLNGWVSPTLTNNVLDGTVLPVVAVQGSITRNVHWSHIEDLTWLVWSNVTVTSGDTLTLDEDLVVKFLHQSSHSSNRYMRIQGVLDLRSSPGHEVIFTSSRDDDFGGDSNGDDTAGNELSASSSDWGYLRIDNSDNLIHDLRMRYGGRRDSDRHNVIYVAGYSPEINRVSMENCYSSATGIYYSAAQGHVTEPRITHCSISNLSTAIYLDGNGSSVEATRPYIAYNDISDCGWALNLSECRARVYHNTISHNTASNEGTRHPLYVNGWAVPEAWSGNDLNGTVCPTLCIGGTINRSARLRTIDGMPWTIWNNLTVDSGDTLTMDADLVVKFLYQSSHSGNRYMHVNGILDLNSYAGHEVIFTSSRDDDHGGDTNGDDVEGNEFAAGSSDWGYLRVANSDNDIHDMIFRYGGRRDSDRHVVLYVSGYSPVVRRNTFVDCYSSCTAIDYDAAQSTVSSPQITSNTISGVSTAINVDGNGSSVTATTPYIAYNTISDCGWAFNLSECRARIEHNDLDHSTVNNEGTRHPLYVNGWAVPQSWLDNDLNGMVVPTLCIGGTVSRSTRLSTIDGMPWTIWNNLTVDSGDTLTMDADLVVKFLYQSSHSGNRYMLVNGILVLNSYAGHEVVFTSSRDDDFGGDTNGDDVEGNEIAAGSSDWGYLRVANSDNDIHDMIFRYGGRRDSDRNVVLYVSGYSPLVRRNTFVDCYSSCTAIDYDAAQSLITSPQITHNTINGVSTAINVDGNSASVDATTPYLAYNEISDCTWAFNLSECRARIEHNSIDHSTVNNEGFRNPLYVNGWAVPATWLDNELLGTVNPTLCIGGTVNRSSRLAIHDGMPWTIYNNLIVDSGDTLSLDAGLVVKFLYQSSNSSKRYMRVDGILDLNSAPGHEVVFTSSRDDDFGGDTNGDDVEGNEYSANRGDYGYLRIRNGDNQLHDMLFRYGGYRSDHSSALWIDSCSPSVTHCQFENVYNNGNCIYYYAHTSLETQPVIVNNITSGGVRGLYFYGNNSGTSIPVINGNEFSHASGQGIYLRQAGSEASINYNSMHHNGVGVYLYNGFGEVHNCDLMQNASYGYQNASGSVVDASDNYWGDATGPQHSSNPGGLGDVVTDNVSFSPFASAPVTGAPPTMWITPGRLRFQVFPGAEQSLQITMGNAGVEPMQWTLQEALSDTLDPGRTEIAWMDANPMGGELDGGATTTITIHVNALGMSSGVHAAALVLGSNDPANGLISIPLVMHVGEAFVNAASSGAVYHAGDNAEVSWQLADPQNAVCVDLLLSTDGGENYSSTIAESLSPASGYTWELGNTYGEDCRLQAVTHMQDGSTLIAVDPDPFTIRPRNTAPAKVNDLAIAPFGEGRVQLAWTPVTHDTQGQQVVVSYYRIYASDQPVFLPGEGELVLQTEQSSALLSVTQNRAFYHVVAVIE